MAALPPGYKYSGNPHWVSYDDGGGHYRQWIISPEGKHFAGHGLTRESTIIDAHVKANDDAARVAMAPMERLSQICSTTNHLNLSEISEAIRLIHRILKP